MNTSFKLSNMLIACLMLVNLSTSQVTSSELPKLQMASFDSPQTTNKFTLSDENKFVLKRTLLNPKECELSLHYEFENEGLISVFNESEGKNVWSSIKYVSPGNPLTLMTRKIQGTLKKESVFMDLCREGLWKEKRNLSEIVKFWNVVDWDKGYLQQWNVNVKNPYFLRFKEPEELNLKKFNLNLFNQKIFESTDEKPVDFSLNLLDREMFSKKVFNLLEEALTKNYRLLYKLNGKSIDQTKFVKPDSIFSKIMSNFFPYSSKFFGLTSKISEDSPKKPVSVMGLKLDIDHILNLMKSELLNRNELFKKSGEIHERHHKEFLPMTKNKLFILTQMIWKMSENDPYHQFNNLLSTQLESFIEILKEDKIDKRKLKLSFTELFVIYYSQIVGGFDNLGIPSPYLTFVNEYLTKIFNRIKTEMNLLGGLVTQDKNKLMAEIQGNMIKVYNFLESNEPILIPNLPRFVKSAENVAVNFLEEFTNATQEEKNRILSSLYYINEINGSSRRTAKDKFNPFVLANKKNVLF